MKNRIIFFLAMSLFATLAPIQAQQGNPNPKEPQIWELLIARQNPDYRWGFDVVKEGEELGVYFPHPWDTKARVQFSYTPPGWGDTPTIIWVTFWIDKQGTVTDEFWINENQNYYGETLPTEIFLVIKEILKNK